MKSISILTLLLLTLVVSSAETIRFIHASPENTRLADGSPLPDDLGSCGWKWRPDKGNGGVFESVPPQNGKSAIMMTHAKGLDPGTVYEVFGYFWADGFDKIEPEIREQRPAQFGVTLATLQTFDGKTPPVDGAIQTWMVTPGSNIGEIYGYAAAIEENQPLDGMTVLKHRDGNGRLIRARLGLSKADKDGTLPVFFADYPYKKPSGPAWIDGLAVRRAKPDMVMDQGFKTATRLHLALRASDPVTIARELAMGADVNALDEDNLTPLYYASASDDTTLMRKLLDMRANPDQPGQAIPTLSAAVSTLNTEAVKILLDAGAQVPRKLPVNPIDVGKPMHPAYMHPVIMAIRMGSVPVLKLLLEVTIDLKIESILALDSYDDKTYGSLDSPRPYLVENAILKQQWDMAEFLLDHGCGTHPKYKNFNRPNNLDVALLQYAVQTGKPAEGVIQRLLDRGIPPVYDPWGDYPSRYKARSIATDELHQIPIEDALKGAVQCATAEIVRRFLPNAKNVTPRYQDELYMIALYRDDIEIIDLVKNQFPDVAPSRWAPKNNTKPEEYTADEQLRMFLPRTIQLPTKNIIANAGNRTIAVISSPDAEGIGAALSAYASKQKNWIVVDRDLVESAINESHLAKPWQNGQHNISGLGDILSADTIIIVSQAKGQNFNVYCLEVVEVATGLVVHREHLQDKLLKPENDFKDLLERAAMALDAAGKNERHQAVTLLPFSPSPGLPNGLALSRLLRASVQHHIDDTPGMISLTRQQSSRLMEEQALKGASRIWGASHMMEGGVSAVEIGKIKVALRLETFQGNGSVIKDAEAIGTPEQLPELAKMAWQDLFHGVAREVDKNGVIENKTKNKLLNAQKEWTRLLREAEWLNAVNAGPDAVLHLVESAVALGAPRDTIMPLHLDALFRKVSSISRNYNKTIPLIGFSSTNAQSNVHLIDSDRMAYQLTNVRELLHLTSICLEDFNKKYINNHQDNIINLRKISESNAHIWSSFNALYFVRASIFKKLIPPDCREEYRLFCDELDDLTKNYFDIIQWLDPYFSTPQKYPVGVFSFNKNNEFEKLLLNMTPGVMEYWIHKYSSSSFLEYKLRNDIIAQCIDFRNRENNAFNLAEIANLHCMSLGGKEARKWAMSCVKEVTQSFSDESFDYSASFAKARKMGLDLYTTSEWHDSSLPIHGSSLLPSLLHNSRMATDYKIRPGNYMHCAFIRSCNPDVLKNRKEMLAKMYVKNRYSWMAEKLMKENDVDGYRKIQQSAHLFELLCGLSYSDVVKEKFKHQLSQTPQKLTAELFKDLRDAETLKPGYVFWPFMDRSDPNLLWIFQIESNDQSLPSFYYLRDSIVKDPLFSHAWLLAVDLKNGKTIKKINLKREAGKVLGKNLDDFGFTFWDKAFDQTNDNIMTNVQCIKKSPQGQDHEYCVVSLVIDKNAGTAKMLPLEMIALHKLGNTSLHNHNPVVGLGEEFYFLDNPTLKEYGLTRTDHWSTGCLYRLNPMTMKIETVVEIGRRPAMTPFDADGNNPSAIVADKDVLLVCSDKHYAHYNPSMGSWKEDKDRVYDVLGNSSQRQDIQLASASHDISVNLGKTSWKVASTQSLPGTIRFTSKDSKNKNVVINYEIPKDFADSVSIVMRGHIETKYSITQGDLNKLKFQDYIKQNKLYITVLSQTETDLILTLQMQDEYSWSYPSRKALYLPFFWRIPKNKLIEILENDSPR